MLGIALVSALWWLYFDVVAILGAQRLVQAPEGRERNELARDVFSYMHFLLVAGIELAAVGLHEILAHVDDPLKSVPAFALLGGVAIYLLGHVAIRYRHVRTINRQRGALAILLVALVPLATEVAPLVVLGAITGLLAALIVYETRSYGEDRGRVRRSFETSG
jgi:low temperature requirement protein LtrA